MGYGSFYKRKSKNYNMKITNKDMELILGLLHTECDHHVYRDSSEIRDKYRKFFKERYNHMQDLINALTKELLRNKGYKKK
jgi:hypothetical protein